MGAKNTLIMSNYFGGDSYRIITTKNIHFRRMLCTVLQSEGKRFIQFYSKLQNTLISTPPLELSGALGTNNNNSKCVLGLH